MISIQTNVPLLDRNTFGIAATASVLVTSDSAAELSSFLKTEPVPSSALILGGGSNMLFVSPRCGTVIHPAFKGIEVTGEDAERALVRAHAGETWDDLVAWCVGRNYAGMENLSLIPGTVGACPVQNIGAYGAEAQHVIERVEAMEIATGRTVIFRRDECRFGYRDSIFKQHRGKYLVVSVWFGLSKRFTPNLSYAGLKAELPAGENITAGQVREAVIRIRRQKLPDYRLLGNAGSFFKNPVVSAKQAAALKRLYGDVPLYPAGRGLQKTSAAWLIQQCGWKGARKGNVGSYLMQPLILVNYGNASGREVLDFAEEIIRSVEERFGVRMEPEVNIV
ncbi:MAG: UDP-N-acetylmuramate dehydrogenase [Bacteroidales bacterium]|jgi:UDP-N-acetylmuramate dehydrogenase|nr:UDP-N-acetylmuramate dehydrogenase [Bacteroidales bacterium]